MSIKEAAKMALETGSERIINTIPENPEIDINTSLVETNHAIFKDDSRNSLENINIEKKETAKDISKNDVTERNITLIDANLVEPKEVSS